jgi:uroporphyrinogen-III decarboxylase
MNIEGFFWTPRELMGIEPHMYAFYDYPEMMHDMNEYILNVYLKKLTKVLEIVPVDVLYIMEDLSGKNGPMISPDQFDEFVGSYYKRLIPELKARGVKHVFVDTDGDFKKLIPNFIKAGVEGFLPMDVNAGMDIVEIRKNYPDLKFIGGFNKLCIAEGKASTDKEFERILPVVRQGGYVPGCDHQVAPSTSLENYKYYVNRLKEIMLQCGADLAY